MRGPRFAAKRSAPRHLPSPPFPILKFTVKRNETRLHYSFVGSPPNTWASCSEGTDPLSPACPTRAHLSWTWTGEDAPPPKNCGEDPLLWRLDVENVARPQSS
jgi:hypothetical protein